MCTARGLGYRDKQANSTNGRVIGHSVHILEEPCHPAHSMHGHGHMIRFQKSDAAQPECHKCDAGQGQERKESRRRRGGRGKRNNIDDSLEGSHRKPPSPKLADLIMPVLKAREKAQSEALEKQRGGSAPPEGAPAPEEGDNTTEAADPAAEASAATVTTPGEMRR